MAACSVIFYTGEFGIVYKAHIVKHKDGQVFTEIKAVKTLKGEAKLMVCPCRVIHIQYILAA